jgi:GTP cyclohydrolase II
MDIVALHPAVNPLVRKTKRPHSSTLGVVAQAVAVLRRGDAVQIEGKKGRFFARAVETATAAGIADLGPNALLLLTHARARTLKIRLYTPEVVALPVKGLAPDILRAIADPTADLEFPLKGPFHNLREALPDSFSASIKLAKLAGLLPATLVAPAKRDSKDIVKISVADIASFEDVAVRTLSIVTRARVPLEGAEDAELVAFRARDGGPEHYAIVIGTPSKDKPVLVRLHSECFTGDLLGSLKCDCGQQLRGAIDVLAKAGSGILLYLAQEGRGIGLINKLRAYRLQDQGFDTLDANERLGFAADERRYAIAAKILSLLSVNTIKLLTNNPDKVKAMKKEGVKVMGRVRHAFPANTHNRAYLSAKAKRAGHLL